MIAPNAGKKGRSANLLHGEWTSAEIAAVLARQPRKPLLPPMQAGEWQCVARNPLVQKLAAPARDLAEQECTEPLPELTDELYGHFHRTGVRLTFEVVYFERRRRLARAALSLLLAAKDDPWRDKFVASVLSKFQDIFEEVSWALPAHTNWSHDDPSGKEPMQIDLFCAETANLMAEMLDVFGDVIPNGLRDRVRQRLTHGIFDNFMERDFHWMEVTHNWNAVCHQGVVGAALSQIDDPERLAAILDRMRTRLPHFLKGYSPDGGCSEGPGYWGYGFGWFTVLNEQLETRTGGELSLFADDAHIHEIARYGPRMALSGGNLVNFADGVPSGGLRPSVLSYLADRLDDPECRGAAGEAYRRLLREGFEWEAERADVFSLFRTLLLCPTVEPTGDGLPSTDCFLPDLGVLVTRGKDSRGRLWEFAAKGGHNGEHHNHNDCGSYIVNIDGSRVIHEIGAPEYTHDFFGVKRYDFLAARSLGHSVPFVNGCEQSEGENYAASVLSVRHGQDGGEFVLDLTRCYPPRADCRRLHRRFLWQKAAGVLTVTDDFELNAPGVVQSLIICGDPVRVQEGDGFITSAAGSTRIRPVDGARLLPVETCFFQDHDGQPAKVHRLRLVHEGAALSAGQIAYQISLPD